nr:MAG TPA: hypothetical protein [Caudoviricetes sp.]
MSSVIKTCFVTHLLFRVLQKSFSGVYFKLNCPIKKEVFLNVQKHFLF